MASEQDVAMLAAAQAMWKALGNVISTKDPRSIRSKLDDELRQLWMERRIFGKIPLYIGNTKVGELIAKQAGKKHRRFVTVNDPWELMEAEKDGFADFVYEHIDQYAEWCLDQGVAHLAGCTVSEYDEEGGWGGTAIVGCKPESTLPILAESGIDVAGYIEGV